jgi:malate/lactate dehydrogenase
MPHFIMLTSSHLCFLALQTNATALALVDVDEKKLKGECLDLIQGTAFSSRHVRITYVFFSSFFVCGMF